MPPEVVTVWDGTRQRDPYLGMTWEPPRATQPVAEPEHVEPLCIRCSCDAFDDLVVKALTEKPMTMRELLEALADNPTQWQSRLYNRLNNALRRLRYRGALAVVGTRANKFRVHMKVFGIVGGADAR